MPQTSATHTTTLWDEKTYQELPNGTKFTRVTAGYAYKGESDTTGINATSNAEYLMFYRADGTGTFAGLEYVRGTIDGKSGTFVLQHSGSWTLAEFCVEWTVVPMSGSEELTGLQGGGGSQFLLAEPKIAFALEYTFA